MRTENALMDRVRSRWSHYVLLGRWRRADRIKALMLRLGVPKAAARRRKSA